MTSSVDTIVQTKDTIRNFIIANPWLTAHEISDKTGFTNKQVLTAIRNLSYRKRETVLVKTENGTGNHGGVKYRYAYQGTTKLGMVCADEKIKPTITKKRFNDLCYRLQSQQRVDIVRHLYAAKGYVYISDLKKQFETPHTHHIIAKLQLLGAKIHLRGLTYERQVILLDYDPALAKSPMQKLSREEVERRRAADRRRQKKHREAVAAREVNKDLSMKTVLKATRCPRPVDPLRALGF